MVSPLSAIMTTQKTQSVEFVLLDTKRSHERYWTHSVDSLDDLRLGKTTNPRPQVHVCPITTPFKPPYPWVSSLVWCEWFKLWSSRTQHFWFSRLAPGHLRSARETTKAGAAAPLQPCSLSHCNQPSFTVPRLRPPFLFLSPFSDHNNPLLFLPLSHILSFFSHPLLP